MNPPFCPLDYEFWRYHIIEFPFVMRRIYLTYFCYPLVLFHLSKEKELGSISIHWNHLYFLTELKRYLHVSLFKIYPIGRTNSCSTLITTVFSEAYFFFSLFDSFRMKLPLGSSTYTDEENLISCNFFIHVNPESIASDFTTSPLIVRLVLFMNLGSFSVVLVSPRYFIPTVISISIVSSWICYTFRVLSWKFILT